MSRVVHFEIMAREPEKAIDFYSKVLDWKFEKPENTGSEYWHVLTGDEQRPGINGGLASGDPVGAVVNTIGIAELNATLEKVEENGGKVIQPPVHRPGMGWYASFADPAGNQFGLLQPKAAEEDCPETADSESKQQSLPGCSDERVRHEPARTLGGGNARRKPSAARPSPARTSRSGARPARSRGRSSR